MSSASSAASSYASAASAASSASSVPVATGATYATYIKEIIANMPDDLNSKKEIDDFYKAAIKDIKGKIKDNNKAAKAAKAVKAAKAAKKKKGKKESDEDDVEKVKKPPSAYQIFLKENRQTVKEENPELTGKECTALLRTMWSKHKEDNA